MKKRINLLVKQKKYTDLERIFGLLKIGVVIVAALLFGAFFLYFTSLKQKRSELDNLLLQKQELLTYLASNKEVEAKFVYFRSKEKQLSDSLKKDVNFYPYYNLLNNSLKTSTPEPRLESVVIDKTKNVEFKLSFIDYASLISFFRFAESEPFLQNFAQLSLTNFNTGSLSEGSYELGFNGRFIPLENL